MKQLINKILGSLDTHSKNSFSARKLSAFVVMVLVIVLHVKWFKSDKWEYIAEVLALDFTFILVCLGLATWQSIKEKQNESTKAE
jgi:hypothetical protein